MEHRLHALCSSKQIKKNLRVWIIEFLKDVIRDIFNAIPFRDAIYRVVSSKQNGHLSFENILDFCTVFSVNCPQGVRATWAFEIYGKLVEMQFNLIHRLCVPEILTFVPTNICSPLSYRLIKHNSYIIHRSLKI